MRRTQHISTQHKFHHRANNPSICKHTLLNRRLHTSENNQLRNRDIHNSYTRNYLNPKLLLFNTSRTYATLKRSKENRVEKQKNDNDKTQEETDTRHKQDDKEKSDDLEEFNFEDFVSEETMEDLSFDEDRKTQAQTQLKASNLTQEEQRMLGLTDSEGEIESPFLTDFHDDYNYNDDDEGNEANGPIFPSSMDDIASPYVDDRSDSIADSLGVAEGKPFRLSDLKSSSHSKTHSDDKLPKRKSMPYIPPSNHEPLDALSEEIPLSLLGNKYSVYEYTGALLTIDEVFEILEERKAMDVAVLDAQGKCSFANYMIFASGTSLRHLKSLGKAVVNELKKRNIEGLNPCIEGYDDQHWMLVDGGNFVLHLFSRQGREYYDLERKWAFHRREDFEQWNSLRNGYEEEDEEEEDESDLAYRHYLTNKEVSFEALNNQSDIDLELPSKSKKKKKQSKKKKKNN